MALDYTAVPLSLVWNFDLNQYGLQSIRNT